MAEDRPSRIRPAESQSGPVSGYVYEDGMVAMLLETRELTIAQRAEGAAMEGEPWKVRTAQCVRISTAWTARRT